MPRWSFDQTEFDDRDGRLRGVGGTAHLRPKTARLLAYLLERPGQVIERGELARAIWGEQAVIDFGSGLAGLLRELRQALSEVGSDAGMVETVPRRGLRLNADVELLAAKPDSNLGREFDIRRRVLAVSGLAVLIAIAAAVWFGNPPRAPSARHSLAILPLDTFAEGRRSARSTGILLADNLLAQLWQAELPCLELIGRTGMQPYAGRDDVAGAVAADLDVNLLLEGSLEVGDGRWQVVARLLALPPARVVWSRTLRGEGELPPAGVLATELVEALRREWPQILEILDNPGV